MPGELTFAHIRALALHHAEWLWAPGIVVPLAVTALLYSVGTHALWRSGRGRGVRVWQVGCFWTGWLVLALALVSPLHDLSEQLFSFHMVQHELLMAVGAPLVILGRPLVPMLWALPPRARRSLGAFAHTHWFRSAWTTISTPLCAWILHAAAIWVWHAPVLFQATLTSATVHAAQHFSFVASALLFWWALVHGRHARMSQGAALVYLFTTALHTGALGALLTFSRTLWYPAYASAGAGWGITPLQDQQLAGLIMWIPATMVYLIAGLILMASWLRNSEVRVTRYQSASLTARQAAS